MHAYLIHALYVNRCNCNVFFCIKWDTQVTPTRKGVTQYVFPPPHERTCIEHYTRTACYIYYM